MWVIDMSIDIDASNQLIQIGLNVRFYRNLENLTQEELAERAGISIPSVSRLENPNQYSNTELMTLLKIAIALGVSPAKFFEFRTKD